MITEWIVSYDDDGNEIVKALVKCKDCKHYNNPKKCIVSKLCELKKMDRFLLFDSNWFCGDGERK